MSRNIIVSSRVMHKDLYEKAKSLIDIDAKDYFVAHPKSADANGYLWSMFHLKDCDWVVNVDEDCFMLNNSALIELIDYMEENNYDYCGLSDGGVYHTRKHNPVAMNPFFNVFNMNTIRPKIEKADRNSVVRCRFEEDMKKFEPTEIMKEDTLWTKRGNRKDFLYDNFEEYYGYFFWLLKSGFKPMFLDASNLGDEVEEFNDRVTTMVYNQNKKPICLHTWYARNYRGENKKRIDSVCEYAKKINMENR